MTFYHSAHAQGSDAPEARELRWTNLYQAKVAPEPQSRWRRILRRNIDLLSNSGSLMATTLINSGLGFGYWWVAARSFSQSDVGAVSAAVATMTLIGMIGVFGLGSLLVAEIQRVVPGTEWNLVATAGIIASAAAMVGGGVYVGIGLAAPSLLGHQSHDPVFLALLIVGCALTALQSVVDEALMGLLAGKLQLLRNAYMAAGKLALLLVLLFIADLPIMRTPSGLLGTWVIGICLSFLALGVHLAKSGLLRSLRPRLSMLKGKWRRAFGHNVLNLALFIPRSALPILVTALVSAQATAGFYTAWMAFLFIAMIPIALSNTLYAIAATDVKALRSKVRFALLISVGVGGPLALLAILGSNRIMAVFGSSYAEAGIILTLLCLTYPASILRNLYVAIARVRGRLRFVTGFAVVAGLIELGATAYGAKVDGLVGLTKAFVIVVLAQSVVFLPAVLRTAGMAVPPKPPTPPALPQQRSIAPKSHRRTRRTRSLAANRS